MNSTMHPTEWGVFWLHGPSDYEWMWLKFGLDQQAGHKPMDWTQTNGLDTNQRTGHKPTDWTQTNGLDTNQRTGYYTTLFHIIKSCVGSLDPKYYNSFLGLGILHVHQSFLGVSYSLVCLVWFAKTVHKIVKNAHPSSLYIGLFSPVQFEF